MKKRILIACGTGIATSTVVADKVRKLLEGKKVKADIQQCKVVEVPSKASSFDLIITTTLITADTGGVPVIRTVSFLSGIGMEKDIQLILEKLGIE